jgi:tRNA pseudouridine55 synthase
VLAVMKTFLGDQYQMPPMFSAIKIDGVPLYKKARQGEDVVREQRFIRVASIELTSFALPQFSFRLRCSKGTYVRTIAHDIGQKIGCGAHLSALRRTATDRFRVEESLTLDQIEALPVREIEKHLLPVHMAVPSVALG